MLSKTLQCAARRSLGENAGISRLVRRKFSSSRSLSSQELPESLFKITTLPNGLRVVTDGPPHHFSTLGVYIDAGTRYEDSSLIGVSHVIDRLSYLSTVGMSAETMELKLASLGGNHMCLSSREIMLYQAAVFNHNVEEMFELMAATIRWPQITEEELKNQKESMRYEIAQIWEKPDMVLPECVDMCAYRDNTLGLPPLCPEERLDVISRNDVMRYREKFYTPERMVVAFIGVDHDRAVEMAHKQFGDMQKSHIPVEREVSRYVGGVHDMGDMPVEHVPNEPELARIYLGFEALALDDPDIYAIATLQVLLGGGGSFSAGGPGKGMYSRLYTGVLNRYAFIENCQSFNHVYSDSGVFGISVACLPSYAKMVPQIICGQLGYLMSSFAGGLTQTDVTRAKNQLRSTMLMTLESKLVQLEDTGRQVLQMGTRVPVEEMCAKIDALTVSDIRRVAKRVLRGNVRNKGTASRQPTVVTQGEPGVFGDVLVECKKFGLAH
ncbi:Metalloenzyme, LuxS/M16 peptidase-like protein [Myxozyma melibiosi]|uniref:Metalloenzyme, LuxS/M16 peptidase-like protein n=1 Tax=Myxozyma melibiosi TaxID=54550 RepID=A0ABR1EZB9_9ASCO